MNGWKKAFVLHNRPYSESSLLVDLFVESEGRITVLAKGARRKRSALKGMLQPFTPLILQYSGQGEVKTLRQVEAVSLAIPLSGVALYSAFYLNELVHRVIIAQSDTSMLFSAYLESLQLLAKQVPSECVLRQFELILLEYLGYLIDFEHCYATGEAIVDSMTYQYHPEKGFISSLMDNTMTFKGIEIKAFSLRVFEHLAPETLKAAKRFTRIALKPYVGSKPFKSRELFLKL